MMNGRHIPHYEDGSDFDTNAESYLKDLARKERLIKELSLKIMEYDKELAKRFAEWDKLIERFPDDVRILLEQWLLDGTLGDILTEQFLSGKSNIITNSIEPLNPNNQTYWYQVTNTFEVNPVIVGIDYDYIQGGEA